MAIWDDLLTPLDREVLQLSGYGARQGLGERPAILAVDVTYNFTGERSEPIVDAVRRSRNACGADAWAAVDAIRRVLGAAREMAVPVIYTVGEPRRRSVDVGRWGGKNVRAANEGATGQWDQGNRVVDEIAPQPADYVLRKAKPSAFFGTPLPSYLNELNVDTLIVMGGTTSGCVRATVIDAFSFNYRVGVVLEGTFDRFSGSHKINLFDMWAKYADIITVDEATAYLRRTTHAA
jgi:nicotinamidase-related amidase